MLIGTVLWLTTARLVIGQLLQPGFASRKKISNQRLDLVAAQAEFRVGEDAEHIRHHSNHAWRAQRTVYTTSTSRSPSSSRRLGTADAAKEEIGVMTTLPPSQMRS